jgi:hypothetical protein
MKKSTQKIEAKEIEPKLAPLVAAFAKDSRVTYGGRGFGSGALKVDGKIFAMVSSKGLFVVKLPEVRVTELVESGRGAYFDAGKGKPMKEWLALTGTPSLRLELAKEAHRFVLGAAPSRR